MRRLLAVAALAAVFVACSEDDPAPQPPITEGGGGQGGSGGTTVDGCPAPGRVVGDGCLDPGVADDGCPAGTALVADVCVPAGIPADACGVGFVHDGDVSCVPVLPAAACTNEGEMFVPGDTACRPIMDCGSGTWGNIPVDSNTIYVDDDYPNNDSDGTEQKPFRSVSAALAAAVGGELIAVAAGSYLADLNINKPVTVHGVCPEQTVILGDPFQAPAAIEISAAASGTAIVGVRVTDLHMSAGIEVNGATAVTIDRVRVTNNIGRGISLIRTAGQAAEATVKDSLIDDNYEIGVFVWGSKLTLERSQIRGTNEGGPNDLGIGVDNSHDGEVASESTIVGSLVEGSSFFGVSAYGSSVVIDDSVVRDTHSRSTDGAAGRGVNAQFIGAGQLRPTVVARRSYISDNDDGGIFAASADVTVEHSVVRGTRPGIDGRGTGVIAQPSTSATSDSESQLQITASVVEANEGAGVFLSGSIGVMERVVVRDTLPEANGTYGRGVYIRIGAEDDAPVSHMDLRGSVVDNNTDVGVYVAGGELNMSTTIVSSTQPDVEGPGGRGMSIQPNETNGRPGDVTIDSSIVERNSNNGIYVTGSNIAITSSIVRDTAMDLLKKDGRGISLQVFPLNGAPTTASIDSSWIHGNHGLGLLASGATLNMHRSMVSGTRAADNGGAGRGVSLQNIGDVPSVATISDSIINDNAEFGALVIGSRVDLSGTTVSETAEVMVGGEALYGDGVLLMDEALPAQLSLSDCVITDNMRAGVLYLGGELSAEGTALSCNGIDLVDGSEGALSFDNVGGNSCGCPNGAEECRWLGTTVVPPTPATPDDESGDQ